MDNEEIIKEQKRICKKYGATWQPMLAGWKIGITNNIDSGEMPINGLRHPSENGTLGWYIWAGKYLDNADFFAPMHIEHLPNKCPSVLKFLGLPPGWRFLIDDKGYEDVWEDTSLLNP